MKYGVLYNDTERNIWLNESIYNTFISVHAMFTLNNSPFDEEEDMYATYRKYIRDIKNSNYEESLKHALTFDSVEAAKIFIKRVFFWTIVTYNYTETNSVDFLGTLNVEEKEYTCKVVASEYTSMFIIIPLVD